MFPILTPGGPHAFGWAQNTDSVPDHLIVRKYEGKADTPEALFKINSIRNQCKWFIGHTRFATHGSPTIMLNNHPVKHDNIIGVHNGVLTNHADILSVTGRDNPLTEVDSEAIFAAVNRWGHKKGLAKIHGSMVTVYADFRRLDTVMIGRSYGRSLRLGWTDRDNLIWASDQRALDALSNAGIVFTKFSGVSENRLLTICNGDIIGRTFFREPLPMPTLAPWHPLVDLRPLAPTGTRKALKQAQKRSRAKLDAEAAANLRYRLNNNGPMSTRERWEYHPLRRAIMDFLNPPQGDPFLEQIAEYLVTNGFLTMPQIARVLDAMGRLSSPRAHPKTHITKPAKATNNVRPEIIGTDQVSYQGKVMSVDDYLVICKQADLEWEADDKETSEDVNKPVDNKL